MSAFVGSWALHQWGQQAKQDGRERLHCSWLYVERWWCYRVDSPGDQLVKVRLRDHWYQHVRLGTEVCNHLWHHDECEYA